MNNREFAIGWLVAGILIALVWFYASLVLSLGYRGEDRLILVAIQHAFKGIVGAMPVIVIGLLMTRHRIHIGTILVIAAGMLLHFGLPYAPFVVWAIALPLAIFGLGLSYVIAHPKAPLLVLPAAYLIGIWLGYPIARDYLAKMIS